MSCKNLLAMFLVNLVIIMTAIGQLNAAQSTNQIESCTNGVIKLKLAMDTDDNIKRNKTFVQYCVNNTLRTLCSSRATWTRVEASVVCTQLGMSNKGALREGGSVLPSQQPDIYFVISNCQGGESNIAECDGIDLTTTNCSGKLGIVQCKQANCVDSDVRLMGGANIREGRVDICIRDHWATVCHTEDMAGAVCRKLGLAPEGATQKNASFSIDPKAICIVNNNQTLSCQPMTSIGPCVSGSLEVHCQAYNSTITTGEQETNEGPCNSAMPAGEQKCNESACNCPTIPLSVLLVLLVLLEAATVIGAVLCFARKKGHMTKTKTQRVLTQPNGSYEPTAAQSSMESYSSMGPNYQTVTGGEAIPDYDVLDHNRPATVAPAHPPPVGGVGDDEFYNADDHTYAAVNKNAIKKKKQSREDTEEGENDDSM